MKQKKLTVAKVRDLMKALQAEGITFSRFVELLNQEFESDTQEATDDPQPSFIGALQTLINQYSMENCSNTPDFILAEYLIHCLQAFDYATGKRSEWYQQK